MQDKKDRTRTAGRRIADLALAGAVLAGVTLTAIGAFSPEARAVPLHMLLESDSNADPGAEVYLLSYDSLADLQNNANPGGGFTQIGISPGFSIAGFTFDGSAYHLLLESDSNADPGAEVYLLSYASLADLQSNANPGGGFTQIGISPGFSIAGFTFDGSAYQLLLESDANADPGAEIYLLSYASLADLQSNANPGGGFTQIGISPGFSVAGFTFDGSAYQLILESDANADPGAEIYLASYDSLADLLGGSLSSGGFTQIGISAGFSIRGLAADWPPTVPPPPDATDVPEPASVAMLLSGLALAGIAAGRRRRP